MIYLHRIAIFLFFQSSFSGIVPCEEVTWCRIMLSPSVALYVASDTHCDIWLGSRNEVSFCQTLKATKVAKFFMFPPLCSLVLEPDLDTGKKEKAQKWTGDEGGTTHIQLLSLLPKWASENIDFQFSRARDWTWRETLGSTQHLCIACGISALSWQPLFSRSSQRS